MTAEDTILVSEETRPVTIRNGNETVKLGDVISRVYEGEKVQRHEFRTAELTKAQTTMLANPTSANAGKVYRLGPTTTQFNFIDHDQALAPLYENGYQLEKMTLGKGGLSLHAILRPNKPVSLPDPITWDEPTWPRTDKNGKKAVIREAIVVTTSVKPGKAINYHRGWFRLICTNGLEAEIMGFGGVKMNHANWSAERLTQTLELTRTNNRSMMDQEKAMGPMIGNVSGIRHMAELLRSLATQTIPDNAEDEEEPVPLAESTLGNLPLFARQAVAPFIRQPGWYVADLATQFELIANHYQTGPVHTLDLINAVTNPVNRHAIDEGQTSFRSLVRVPTIIRACVQLVGAYSLI